MSAPIANMLYSPGEVSNYLNIPSSTLRRYARLFKEYLSPSAQRRRRKYTTIDLEIFEKIKTLSAEGVLIDEMGPLLAEMPIDHAEIILEDDSKESSRAIVPVNPEVIRNFANVDNKLDQLLAEIAQLRADLEAAKKPWWKRL